MMIKTKKTRIMPKINKRKTFKANVNTLERNSKKEKAECFGSRIIIFSFFSGSFTSFLLWFSSIGVSITFSVMFLSSIIK